MARISETPQELRREAVEESLKLIAGQIISAYQGGGDGTLAHYSRQAAIDAAECGGRRNKLFMRLIRVYHPDRIVHFLERIEACLESGDGQGLAELKALLAPAREKAARVSARQDEAYPAEPEEYGYGEDDFGYSEGSWSGAEDETGYQDYEDGLAEDEGPIDIIEAIKRAYLGNIDAFPSPLELSMMEGDLDLSDCGIDNLDGAEHLRCVSALNLSGNSIQNVEPLSHMGAMEFLDLSHNLIEDADFLAACESLVELDISYNDIEDFAFLDGMENLRCVNVLGNPRMDAALASRLAAKGVIVIR